MNYQEFKTDPTKIEILDLHKISKSKNSSLIDEIQQPDNSRSFIPEISKNQRKIYNRDSLIKIGKSERSLKLPFSLEKFECKEIIIPMLYRKREAHGKVINIRSSKSGSLSRITNGYLPPHLRLREKCSMNKHLENFRRNLKCILNKIVPRNFFLCINEIKSIIKSSDQQNFKIDDCIDCLIAEIFDKAIKEEMYSAIYANLCAHMAKFDDENESKWHFRSSLISRCQKMFEMPLQDYLKSVKKHWIEKIEAESDEKLKNLYRSDIEEQIKKAYDKYFGNTRFIGELYVHDLLITKVIHLCVTSLLQKTNDEDAMLSLCKLIETCGKKIDEEHRDKMNDYIKSMTEIADNKQLKTRIRFRILDIIEMSERKWLLREVQSQKMVLSKTLEEIKSDNIEDNAIAASKFSSSKLPNQPNTKNVQNQTKLKKCKNKKVTVPLLPDSSKLLENQIGISTVNDDIQGLTMLISNKKAQKSQLENNKKEISKKIKKLSDDIKILENEKRKLEERRIVIPEQ